MKNVTDPREAVNPFAQIKVTAYEDTPHSPNIDAIIDVEVFGVLQIRQIRVKRGRLGQALTRLPVTFGFSNGVRSTMAAVWLASPALKVRFDEAVGRAIVEFEIAESKEVSRG